MKLSELKSTPEFQLLFPKRTTEQEDKSGANLLMFKFLSEIETLTKDKLSRKKLAELISTSPSYITQLFRGDKLINLLTIAKLERVLNIEFEIRLKESVEKKTEIPATAWPSNSSQLKEVTTTEGEGRLDTSNSMYSQIMSYKIPQQKKFNNVERSTVSV